MILVLCYFQSTAQLSPGKLAESHSHLEGITNCTQCHELGKKVAEAKCLECHSFIQSLVNTNRGYHASSEVKSKECIDCHSDHHGLNFEMVRFDVDNFDHELTGYSLLGSHGRIECRACHVADNITQPDLKKREDTFLGLQEDCLSCHSDFHQGTLSNDCLACHDFEKFRPAPGFDHSLTEYPLKGQHEDVECKKCHEKTSRNGVSFQLFSGTEFQDCKSCHIDPHRNQIPGNCASCHSESGFNAVRRISSFNHGLTDFQLRGKHSETRCMDCHVQTSDPLKVFQDKSGISEDNCMACHDDVHKGKFGERCIECHSETSFFDLKDLSYFDHSLTDYPLEGKHTNVDCRKCHEERYTDPLDFSACMNCHEDYHEGEFRNEDKIPDCVDCH
ncbi:MAG: cytochrome c family protein, partial [Bacteroidia bacterium]|nr:cytochrome c family protein [Bacteroidia bacterium]